MDIKTRLVNLLNENGFQIVMDNLNYSLDFDSLKYMELLILIEEEFGFDLNESDFIELDTFKDLFALIAKKYEELER